MSRRSRIVGFGSAGLLVVAGILCAFVFSGGLAQNLAFSLVAIGLVLGTALLFYEVGLTEDRDRAREQAARRREEDRHPDEDGHRERTGPFRRSAPRGLDRMRGRPRRLR